MPSASQTRIAWAFVAAQAALLVALVAAPGADWWPTGGAVTAVAIVVVVGGFVLLGLASLGLGRALTPLPTPTASGDLVTTGLYRFVRHPIYSAVLAVVAGLVLRSGGGWRLVAGVALVVFFSVKARWEERRLVERFPGYAEYARRTPRFVPRPRTRPASTAGPTTPPKPDEPGASS